MKSFSKLLKFLMKQNPMLLLRSHSSIYATVGFFYAIDAIDTLWYEEINLFRVQIMRNGVTERARAPDTRRHATHWIQSAKCEAAMRWCHTSSERAKKKRARRQQQHHDENEKKGCERAARAVTITNRLHWYRLSSASASAIRHCDGIAIETDIFRIPRENNLHPGIILCFSRIYLMIFTRNNWVIPVYLI